MASKRCHECGRTVSAMTPAVGRLVRVLCRTCAERKWYPEPRGPITGGLLPRRKCCCDGERT